MKLYNLYLAIVAVAMVFFAVSPASSQQQIGWKRVASTMQSDSLFVMNDGSAPQGQYFIRFQFHGNSANNNATWSAGGLDIPFQGTLKAAARGSGNCWTTIPGYRITLFNKDTAITSVALSFCNGPWGGFTLSPPGWSGTISHIDSLEITVSYDILSTAFPQLTFDFDNWLVTIDGNDQLFYQAGDVGTIQGVVFNDTSGNGIREAGEPGLAGWSVYLAGTHSDSTSTDSLGNYTFSNVPHGSYTVTSPTPSGWIQTKPVAGNYAVSINPETLLVVADFGNYSSTAHVYHARKGWNMKCVPVIVADFSQEAVFPTSTSLVFTFGVSGYEIASELKNGAGYWVKFGYEQLLLIEGDELTNDTVNVFEGWNMIGGITTKICTDQVTTDEPGLEVSSFYGYTGIYVPVDSLEPGEAYWVKASKSGHLMINANPPAGFSRVTIVRGSELPPPPPEAEAILPKQPTAFVLGQNYPNPFNPITNIEYRIMNHEYVSLKVFNILGQEVATLVNQEQTRGSYTITWDGYGVPSGTYVYRLRAGADVETRKMILLR